MPIPTNINTLLSGQVVEWARIEFKKSWDASQSLKTICALANDIDNWGGGYVVIGVDTDSDGRPLFPVEGVPVESVDRSLKNILESCKLIHPDYLPMVEVVDYQEKKLIVIWAHGGYMRPYSSPKTMAKGEANRINWIRKMASTIKPSKEEERELYGLAN